MVWPLVIAAASAGALAYDYLKEKTTQPETPQIIIHEATVATETADDEATRKKRIIAYHVAGAMVIGYLYLRWFRKRR